MKKSTRTLSLVLAAMLALSSFVSCSDSGTNEETTADTVETAASAEETVAETEPEETQIDDGLGNPDFGGYTFRVASCMFGGDYGANRMMYSELTGNPVNDALYESKTYIEDRFNVKYESIEFSDGNELGTSLQGAVNAGDNAYDITINHDLTTFTGVKAGYYLNMKDIEQFNFDQPWWPANAVNALSVGGKLYATSSYLTYLGLHWTRAIMVNKDYAESIGADIPYDLVREGKWTTDALLERVIGLSQDLNGDGVYDPDNDRISFVTGCETFYCLQESQNIQVYKHDSDGNLYLDLDQDKIDTYVQKWRSLIQSDDYYMTPGVGFGETVFVNGKNLYCLGQIGDAYDIYRDTDMRYGFLPSPKFDEYQEGYINCCTDLPWGIPMTVPQGDQLTTVATLCEAISCYNYQNVLPAYYDVAMKSRTADSSDDAEMLQLIADTRTMSTAQCYSLTFNNILGQLGDSNKEVASYIKSNEKVATKMLDKFLNTFSELN